jgi:hypothetical protein
MTSHGHGHSSGPLRQSKPGVPKTDQGPRDNKLVECYRCHQIGHISTDPKCPQHPSRTGRPRFNAQRVIEDKPEGDEEIQNKQPEGHDDLHDSNFWGGSQYDPDDKEDRIEEEPAEEENLEEDEGSEQEVRMSSMRTVQMCAMGRIVRAEEVQDLVIFSRIAEPPIRDIEDLIPHAEGSDNNAGPSNTTSNTMAPAQQVEIEEPSTNGSSENMNESIHSHLFDYDAPIH